MPMIAATVKVAALALLLTCVGSVHTPETSRGQRVADANAPRLQCRMYFGCLPPASFKTTDARHKEFIR
jgi:hypothetical protein